MMRLLGIGMLAAMVALAGCSSDPEVTETPPVLVKPVMSADQCGADKPGLQWMSGVAPEEWPPSLKRRFNQVYADGRRDWLVVSLGQRPTAGYNLTLESAAAEDDILAISVRVNEPGENAMVAQVMTQPCLILSVLGEGWKDVVVSAPAEGFPLETTRPE
ncbi:protease complex subunit PrcB family protein [Marinobacteraceae bacterium S3BR75-40.1]